VVVMEYTNMGAPGEFTFGAKEFISYKFLETFHEKYTRLVDAISTYIANYNEYSSSFLVKSIHDEKIEVIKTIKREMSSVIYFVEVINSEIGNKKVSENIEELKRIYKKIVRMNEIPYELLEEMNKHLSYIMGLLFLTEITRRFPSRAQQLLGDFERSL